MSRQTEKVFKELNKYAEENGRPANEEELKKMLSDFISQYEPETSGSLTEETAKTSDDFMELYEYAQTKKDALKYAKRALELDPDNLDAAAAVIRVSTSDDEKRAEKYKKLIAEADEKLKAKGWFDEDNIGSFWLITETRPYMRLLYDYACLLSNCGQMRLSAAVYEKMLKLCTGDNLGVRYLLMHVYAFLEEQKSAEELLAAYPEESSQFLLPVSILYYKLGDLRTSARYLKKLNGRNKDTYKFFKAVLNGNEGMLLEKFSPGEGYRPDTIDELVTALNDSFALYNCSVSYFIWAEAKLRAEKKKK